jgi:oligopeptidase A
MNSLLSTFFPERDLGLPQFDRFDAAEVQPAIAQLLSRYEAMLEPLLSTPVIGACEAYEAILLPIEQLEDELHSAFSTVQHLHRVRSSDALRLAYGPALEQVSAFQAALMQNARYYQVLLSIANARDFSQLAQERRAAVTQALRDLRLGGVALDDTSRARFREISQSLSQLSTDFEEALMDATEAWKLHLPDAARLQGLPADVLQRFSQAALSAKSPLDGYLIGLDYSSYHAVLSYCTDRDLRAQIYRAYLTRASDQQSQSPQQDGLNEAKQGSDNGPRIAQMLALKAEAAQLLGFASAAHESLASKMAESPEQVFEFLHLLLTRARPMALAEFAELQVFANSELGLNCLEPWDLSFVSEKYKAKTLGFDDASLRPYFEFEHVLVNLFTIMDQVFGVQVRATKASCWHADVRYFELFRDREVIASFYLDPFARAKKRSGAWMDVCRTQRRVGDRRRIPVAYLVCNFPAPSAENPSLLTHSDVRTLFHEFGHGLHHMLSEVCSPTVGGISGVEWDAVELPSQFLENFCWQAPALDLLARHYQTGAAMPQALAEKLLASRSFQSGLFLVRQLEFALFDFTIHALQPSPDVNQVMAILNELRTRTSVLTQPDWNRFAQAFSHIFGGGYSAGYYSYLWAEVLSADAFSPFVQVGVGCFAKAKQDTFCRASGEKFRREILAVGGTRAAMDSFKAYMGRAPKQDALLDSYGINHVVATAT